MAPSPPGLVGDLHLLPRRPSVHRIGGRIDGFELQTSRDGGRAFARRCSREIIREVPAAAVTACDGIRTREPFFAMSGSGMTTRPR